MQCQIRRASSLDCAEQLTGAHVRGNGFVNVAFADLRRLLLEEHQLVQHGSSCTAVVETISVLIVPRAAC